MIEDSGVIPIDEDDVVLIPVVAWSDLSLSHWSKYWTLRPNGKMGCTACQGEQASSQNYLPFIHEQHCRLKVDGAQRPWTHLKQMLANLSEEKEQCPF
jgi:hypothetical protein